MKKTSKNRLEIIAILTRFETLCEDKFEKNVKKRRLFVSNFHFGKCVQNICKNRFEINASCMHFETLFGD